MRGLTLFCSIRIGKPRMTFAEKIYSDVEKALYEKGVTKVQFLTAVDDTRKTLRP